MSNIQIGYVTTEHFSKIKQLQTRCALIDGYALPLHDELWSQRMSFSLPTDILFWDKNQVVGYAGIFFFSMDIPEVIIFVDPDKRQSGLALQLLQILKKNLLSLKIKQFSLININPNLKSVIKRHGGRYEFAELRMQTNAWSKQHDVPMLTMKKILPAEFEQLIALHQRCFTSSEMHNRERFQENLKNLNYSIYFFYHDEHLVGKIHTRQEKFQTKLCDICILPEFQNKKLGKALMENWYNQTGNQLLMPFYLEVRENNKPAFQLYKSCGFTVQQRHTFWLFKN